MPAFLRNKLLTSASTRVDRELAGFLERGADHLDDWLGTVAGFCAGLRSDANPIGPDDLPAPFGRDELVDVHRWILGRD